MATALAEQTVLGAYVLSGAATQLTTLTTTAGDPSAMNSIVMSKPRCLVIAQNSDAVNAEWITVYASDDAYGRSTDITQQSIPASGWVAYFFEPHGWEQTLGGKDLLIDMESTDVKLLAIPIPESHGGRTINGPYVGSADATPFSTLNWTAATITGDTVTMSSGLCLILWRNSGLSTRTITIPSSYDEYGRKADIAATNIGAGVIMGRFFQPHGWETTLGGKTMAFTANNAEVVYTVINL